MDECEELDLLRLEGRYLGFIVETDAELNILEHVSRCPLCRAKAIQCVEGGEDELPLGGLFVKDCAGEGAPAYAGDPGAFIEARVKWRKSKLERLLAEAEAELGSLRERL